MTTWGEVNSAISQIDDASAPLRREIARRLAELGCEVVAIKAKMIGLRHPSGAPLAWEYNNGAQWLHFTPETARLIDEPGRFSTRKHSGRRQYSPPYEGPAIAVATGGELDALQPLSGSLFDLTLDRWIVVFKKKFGGFTRFDALHPVFENEERTGDAKKQGALVLMQEGLREISSAEQALALCDETIGRSHLYTMTKIRFRYVIRNNPEIAQTALFALLRSGAEPNDLADAVASVAPLQAKPEGGSDPEAMRSALQSLLMFARPATWMDINQERRKTCARALYGEEPPRADDVLSAAEFDHRLARDLLAGLELRGLGPRDMIDVHGFLWAVLAAETEAVKAIKMQVGEYTQTGNTMSLNTILYGPPGTGKTFATARHAVTICDGTAPEDNTQVQARFHELRAEGRIAFVTFHQSFSYEDFVEGLRPETNSTGAPERGAGGAGFRLVPHPGILRLIAELAAKRPAQRSGTPLSLDSRGVFKMGLGRSRNEEDAYLFEECIEGGFLMLGYGGEIDWSDPAYADFDAILARWRQEEPNATGYNPNVTSIHSLRNDMKVGDFVVVSNGVHGFRAVGEVTGNYEMVERDEDHYRHRRAVRWLWSDADGLPIGTILEGQLTPRTLYRIKPQRIKTSALADFLAPQSIDAPRLPHVLVMDEINRANVSKVFGELITLLEEDKRAGAENEVSVKLPYSQDDFTLPANLHFLGTMNTADRSIALLDTALRRRFDFVEMAPDPALLGVVDGVDLAGLLTAMNDRIEYLVGRDHLVGHAFFMGAQTRSDIDRIMRRKVIPLLCEYFHEDWEKVIAILGDTGQGGFIERKQLPVPPGLDDLAGDPRWRYIVRAEFAADAFAALGQ